MYRIRKVLNHNAVLAISAEDNVECLIMGKGVGFGKKVTENYEVKPNDTVYGVQQLTERGEAKEIMSNVSPECLEVANEILIQAKKVFETVDSGILFSMADHIQFAIQRIKKGELIQNPLTDDIHLLFAKEYEVAACAAPLIYEKFGVKIDDHEIGFLALHIHSAIEQEAISQSMEIARAVRECISMVEQETQVEIDVTSSAYNRLMNHVRYMVIRAYRGEKLRVNINDYMEVKHKKAYDISRKVCEEIGQMIHHPFEEIEIGYLAMHIERAEE